MFKRWIAVTVAVCLAGCAREAPVERVVYKTKTKVKVVAPYCPKKTSCGEMESCAEAVYHLTTCNQYQLDKNANGVPCEDKCGKTPEDMKARMKERPYSPVTRAATRSSS